MPEFKLGVGGEQQASDDRRPMRNLNLFPFVK